jgi:hypothetical protein
MGTDRDDIIRAWERATPLFGQRMRCVENLRGAGLFVVATLSPFGLWDDLEGTAAQLKALGVAYLTILFFKDGGGSTNTPKSFLSLLRTKHPEVLDRDWQEERLAEIRGIFGRNRVLVGRPGFESLVRPHTVGADDPK